MSGSRNNLAMTPGAARTVARCRRQAGVLAQTDSWAAFLVLALLQDESLASACLQRLGITRNWLSSGLLGAEVAQLAAQSNNLDNDNIGDCDNDAMDVEWLDSETMYWIVPPSWLAEDQTTVAFPARICWWRSWKQTATSGNSSKLSEQRWQEFEKNCTPNR